MAFVTAVVIISFTAVFMSGWLHLDTSAISVIVPSAYGELAVHTGFVIWKAKAENQIKLKKEYGELADSIVNEPAYENPPVGYDTWGK